MTAETGKPGGTSVGELDLAVMWNINENWKLWVGDTSHSGSTYVLWTGDGCGVAGHGRNVGRWAPKSIVRGIQLSLDMMPAIQRGKTVSSWRLLGAVAVVIVLAPRRNRHAPATVVLVALGIVIMALRLLGKEQRREDTQR